MHLNDACATSPNLQQINKFHHCKKFLDQPRDIKLLWLQHNQAKPRVPAPFLSFDRLHVEAGSTQNSAEAVFTCPGLKL